MDKNKSLRSQILAMKVGAKLVVPLESYGYTTIRSYASELGFAAERVYKTARNREERTYTITRIS